MSADSIILTKDPVQLANILDRHAEISLSRLMYRRTLWLLAWYYLNGARRFEVFDPGTGALQPYFLDTEGNMEFQCQELVNLINQVAGRLAGLDLWPKVVSRSGGLEALRQRATTQVILDSAIGDDQLERVKREFAYIFTALGSCGITGHVIDHPTIGLTADLEVVHPKELHPFPALGYDHTKQRGLMRERVVPMKYLEGKFSRQLLKAHRQKLDYYTVPAGAPLAGREEDNLGVVMTRTARLPGAGTPGDDEDLEVVRVRELWLDGPRGTCARYILASGEYIFTDDDFSGQEMYCPVGFSRFFESGTMHGLGLFDVAFPIHRQLELLLKSLFNNIRDLDKYGVLVLPNGQYNERGVLRDIGRGLRVLPWEPDPIVEGFHPFSIQPHNLGDVPGKVAVFARQLMQNLNPAPDLAAEKGRVDSYSGLQYLDEQINRSLNHPTSGIEQAFGACYRGISAQLSRQLITSNRPIPVGRLTLDLMGAVIDPDSQTVSFPQNPIPDLSRLSFTVKETTQKSNAAQKQEALELLKEQVTDPDAFKIYAIKEGLQFAMWMGEDESAYESVVRNCLLLFGDGRDPGQIIVTPHTARPQIQLRLLSEVMSSPNMALASPEVQNGFKQYRQTLINFMGMTLPSAIPNPDDAAMLSGGAPSQPPGAPMGAPQPPGAPNG